MTAPLLRKKLAESIDVIPRHLVIDLFEVQFFGSIGLQILVDFRATQEKVGRQMPLVVGNNRVVTRPLQISGLDYAFDLYVEPEMAVKACRSAKTVKEP